MDCRGVRDDVDEIRKLKIDVDCVQMIISHAIVTLACHSARKGRDLGKTRRDRALERRRVA